MQYLSGKPLPRRSFVQGLSATIALPYLEAMIPTGRGAWRKLNDAPRLVAIEMVHGAAGCNELGAKLNLWNPADTGRNFDLSPTAMHSLEAYRKHLTIISNTDVRAAEPFSPNEVGGDHFRSSATYLTQAHARQTEGSDVLDAQLHRRDGCVLSVALCIDLVERRADANVGALGLARMRLREIRGAGAEVIAANFVW